MKVYLGGDFLWRNSERSLTLAIGLVGFGVWLPCDESHAAAACANTVTANVVALDQAFFYNRLGTVNPAGMIYALEEDVVPKTDGTALSPGNVQLREGKRPRPLVLRVNAGDCLRIRFTNLLANSKADEEQPATRSASIHAMGMQPVGDIGSDGSFVGKNPSSLAAPGETRTYTLYAEHEGTFLLYSTGATTGGEGDGGSLAAGLFGAVNVEPAGAEWYRSQVTAEDLRLAARKDGHGNPITTQAGQPIIDYGAVYPASHPRAGIPILRMTQGGRIVHSDLYAIITGPSAGRFPPGAYRVNPAYPDRDQPFREFTAIFHDEIIAQQAFPEFEDPVLGFTLHSVRDGFAINYGTAGVGAEVLANRKRLGPMKDCVECKFEEFFLSSWAIGDPAMIVDVPANVSDPDKGLMATQAFYPDDPSNVHHSYLGDHVKIRNLHAGPKEHHIFHLHAHQWLHTPGSDGSTYLDSQAIGPGNGYTYEIAYNGSGNRNKTPGDAIFHCHFYPHFAQGMWALWRVHDVFEDGTRKLPDGEIKDGTPIPALVPMPTLAMAPMPGAEVKIVGGQAQISGNGNPGYPFFVPGLAGHRPPHPPLDIARDTDGSPMDGGLPRHVITGGTAESVEDRLDFSKTLLSVNARQLPEGGTDTEKAAMAFHAIRVHSSFAPDGTTAEFVTNGLPPQPGAPFADPCVDDSGQAVGSPRAYKAAAFQLDIKINKAGWHLGQARMLALWNDVEAFKSGTKPPEPLFFRANTGECITYYHANLSPGVYELDDFQVRTPTDVIGQHIHLVKFDVTSADGSGNGWNYEDGTFSPDEVIERIDAINRKQVQGAAGGSWNGVPGDGPNSLLTVKAHPFFGTPGAQTTIQRWYADEVINNLGKDRTLRTVYTHDHFGPSTHQQSGLYAGLVIEPQGSRWRDPETGAAFGDRDDGGPTSWHADILTANLNESYREFLLEFADFQLAHRKDGTPVNPPAREAVGLPFLLETAPQCPGGVPRPCPEAISADDPGTMTVNYRNEPIALRVRDPQTNSQAAGDAGDLSKAFLSNVVRKDPDFNKQPDFYPPLTRGVENGDPFTPMIRAYENDKIQVRILIGAHEESHNVSISGGVRWLFEPNDGNSGYRNSQLTGISEHFEFVLPPLPVRGGADFEDFLYKPGSAVDDLWNGLWGIVRKYNGANGLQADLKPLPNNPNGKGPSIANPNAFSGICPKTAPVRKFEVYAVSARDVLPEKSLVYNSRTNNGGKLHDPTAILYVRKEDLDSNRKLKRPAEPLILRANAGDCIQVTLINRLPRSLPDSDGFSTLPMLVEHFNANQVRPSGHVGLAPQLLSHLTDSNGVNIGFNPIQTAAPGATVKYQWYAGNISLTKTGVRLAIPVEYGATNLISSDPIKHSNKGAIGALIIEPRGSTWVEDPASHASATVMKSDGSKFREFVLAFQDDINLVNDDGPVPNLAEAEDPEDSGQKALNYRTEPLWKRMGFKADELLTATRNFDFTAVLANSQVGGDPETPVFTAKAGDQVRFRVLQPGGHARTHVFQVHGHAWQEESYANNSSVIGSNPSSEWRGSSGGHGPTNHFDAVLQNGAGGAFHVPGDYLYRDQASFQFDAGLWGLLRVTP